MVSMYPLNQDLFRKWVHDGPDDMTAEHLNDLLDAVVAIEAQLGVNPSGTAGTIFGRMFQAGNVSLQSAAWTRLQWNSQAILGTQFDRAKQGIGQTFRAGVHDESAPASIWGEGIPGCFGALQDPVMSTLGANSRGGVPWRTMLSVINKRECRFVGYDGEGAELGTANSASGHLGVLSWSLKT